MIDLLRELLEIREKLQAVEDLAKDYGYLDELPEIASMQKLERNVFAKVSEWEKP